MKYIKNKYKLLIGERTAEEIKLKIGTVYSNKKKEKMEVRGRNIVGKFRIREGGYYVNS